MKQRKMKLSVRIEMCLIHSKSQRIHILYHLIIEIMINFCPSHIFILDKQRREICLPEFGIRIIPSMF